MRPRRSLRTITTTIPRDHIEHFWHSASCRKFFYNATQRLDFKGSSIIYQSGIKMKSFSSGVRRPAGTPTEVSKYMGLQLCFSLVKINLGLKLNAVSWKRT